MNLRTTTTLAAAAACLATVAVGGAAQAAPLHRPVPAPAQHQQQHHAIPFTAATVTQNSDGSYTLSWKAPGVRGVTVYAGRTENGIDYRHPVARVGASGTVTLTVAALKGADRGWFRFQPSRGEGLTLADRDLHIASAPNFRDAGGYRTADGQWVRMGVVYRSGDLSQLTAADDAKLQRLGIRTVFDLRTDGERSTAPDKVPAGVKDVQEDVLGGSISSFSPTSAAAAEQEMVDAEATMVDSASAQTAYHAVFTGLADGSDLNALYHCSAGKDRTGWASAVLLTALGVPQSTVMQDYLASNTYRAAVNAATLASLPAAEAAIYQPLLAVEPQYLNNGFAEVKKEYGTFDNYLSKGLHLTPSTLAHLRAELLVG